MIQNFTSTFLSTTCSTNVFQSTKLLHKYVLCIHYLFMYIVDCYYTALHVKEILLIDIMDTAYFSQYICACIKYTRISRNVSDKPKYSCYSVKIQKKLVAYL